MDQESESVVQASTAHVYAVLMMTDTQGRTLERDVLRETTVIGSARGCDVRLKSESVAPVHCILSLDGGTLRLRDLGSRTGTLINGERIQTAILSDGDQLQLGRHHLRIETNLPGRGFRGFYIDVYQITEILGSGGMCWIYGGRNSVTRDRVAIKVLPSHHSARMLAHFGIEARAGLLLSHPNIVRVQKLVQSDSLYFLVMEYLEAITLQEYVESQGPLPWPLACHLIRQLAQGLEHAHHQKVIHRDVKPANVLCNRDGQAKLIDFGLSMITDDPHQEKLARIYANQILGTADYISPEQSRQSHQVDGRADIYSLGCVFFFILTGSVPFPMLAVKDKIKAHRHQPVRDPRDMVPELPSAVADILLRMLAKTPEERFSGAGDVALALEPVARAAEMPFDWQAVLSVRATAAHRRLARLLVRRRQTADNEPLDPTIVEHGDSSGSDAPSHGSRLIEADFMETLRDDSSPAPAERRNWGELFQIWTQMSPEQRREFLEQARHYDLSPVETPDGPAN